MFSNEINLTKEEKTYILKNKKIKVHNEKNWAPINFNKNGIPQGYSIDYINLLASKVGLEVEFVTGDWNDLLNSTMNKKIDVMMNIAYTKDRAKHLLYVDEYLENPTVIIGKKSDDSIKTPESLFGKKVSVVEGFFDEVLLLEKYPLIQRVVYKNSEEALKAVDSNEVDATYGRSVTSKYLINDLALKNIEIKSELNTGEIKDKRLFIATKPDAKVLASILKKAMKEVSNSEINSLKEKWFSQIDSKTIKLTPSQKAWLKENPVIKLGTTNNWPPFDMLDNGKHIGINADFIAKLKAILNVDIQVVINSNWNDVISESKNNKSHGIMALTVASEYEKDFLFTQTYANNPVVVITKNDSKIKNIKDFKNLTTVKGNDFSKELSKEQLLNIKYFNSTMDCFNAVLDGKSEGYIGWLADAQYLISQNTIAGLSATIRVQSEQSALKMGVSKNNPELKEILDLALNEITQEEKNKILTKWIQTNNISKNIELSSNELKWLSTKPVINFAADPTWSPIESINKDGSYEGMNADILALISEISGIKFNLIQTKDWQESTKLSEEKKVDMLACVSKTPKREEYLNFSSKTIELTDGVIMRSDAQFIDSLEDLKNLKVGVPEGTSVHTKLKKEYPLLVLVPIKGTQKAIEMLSVGDIDAYVGNLEVSGYYLQQLGLYNLKVVLKLPETRNMYIALQKDYKPEALSVINKVIQSISVEEIQTIRQRWVGLKVTDETNYKLIAEISVGVLILILFILYSNYNLKRVVGQKTADIQKQKDELALFNKNLEALIIERTKELNSEKNFINLVMNSQNNFVITTDGEILKFANKSMLSFFNVTNEEEFRNKFGNCICDTFYAGSDENYLKKMINGQKWIDYVYENKNETHKVIILKDNKPYIFTVTAEKFEFKDKMLSVAVFSDISELEKAKKEIEKILENILLPVLITSKKSRKILYANKYAQIAYERSIDDLVGSSIDEVYTTENQQSPILEILKEKGKVENLKEVFKTAKGRIFTALLSVTPIVYEEEDAYIGMVTDISELEKVKEEMANSNLLMQQLLNSIPNPIFYKNEYGEFIGFNRAYEKVFAIDSKELLGKTIMDLDYIPLESRKIYNEEDTDIIKNQTSLLREQDMIFADDKVHHTLYSVNSFTKNDGSSGGLIGIFTDITAQKEMEKELVSINKHTRDSIEYASIIQHSLIPSNELFRKYFSEYLTIWHPKDLVGGDIYFFEELRNDDECLLFVIDCTGHGVPGAFVTMLVKAIQRQIVSNILYSEEIVSPAKLLSVFNKSIKHLLKQEDEDSISNAGFDGGILYYNKKDKIIKFAGANTPLFYIEENELKTIKGDRHSVGYKKSDGKFEFKEHILQVKQGMSFYLSTDGYLDQNGGSKGFPFGRKRFENIILENHNLSFADQQEVFLNELDNYQGFEDRNDDITLVGIKI